MSTCSPFDLDTLLKDLLWLCKGISTLRKQQQEGNKDRLRSMACEVLQRVEMVKDTYCNPTQKVLQQRSRQLHQHGLRELIIPADFEGTWYVMPESSEKGLYDAAPGLPRSNCQPAPQPPQPSPDETCSGRIDCQQ